MANSYLKTNLVHLSGIGEKKAKLLQTELGFRTIEDLLFYFPYRYIDRSRIYKINELRDNMPEVQVFGTLRGFVQEGYGRKTRLKAYLEDDTGCVELVWFNAIHYVLDRYKEGNQYLAFGKFKRYNLSYTISHPELTTPDRVSLVTAGLMPFYHTTEKLKKGKLDSIQLRPILQKLCAVIDEYLEDSLPEFVRNHYHLMPLVQAVREAHFPKNNEFLQQALIRLKFDDLFYFQLSKQLIKSERKHRFKGASFTEVGDKFNALYQSLPYELTNAQKAVLRDIRQDTMTGFQMSRLVQGDVGSGKTLVAVFAMLLAIDNGTQACMMAPTEILARQHYASLSEMLIPLGVSVGVLTGSSTKKERTEVLEKLLSGELSILVGTHALIEESVQFAHLGLAVIDEQHRFGVMQRARLWEKNTELLPHILIMSATPIPRTLALSMYGDLDVSIIDELPPGRKPIDTIHIYENRYLEAHQFLAREIQKGRQAYVVFPMIEGTEASDYKNLETGYTYYADFFGEENVEWVHGKLKPQEKQIRMERFVSGEVPILLSTTVIEVGVNVPNASVMLIEDADRFGLAQLHQLRGRVGRGAEKSYCFLMTRNNLNPTAKKRIDAMCATNDGFVIAEEDMKLRGAGDTEGLRQSGVFSELKVADPTQDVEILQATHSLVENLLKADPLLEREEHHVFVRTLERLYPREERWGNIG